MTIQYDTTLRNNRLDELEVLAGASAVLKIWTGAQPANCAAADSGTELVSMTLPSDWMAAASAGSKAKLGTWSGTAGNTGTADHFRLYNSGVTTCYMQGSVGVAAEDIVLDNDSISSGQTVTITTFTITEGNP